MSRTTSATRSASRARRRDTDAEMIVVLRRALHGRDRVDPLPGEDGADPRPRRRLFARGLDRRRAARILARRYPAGVVVMYVNTTAEVKALTDYCCTSANAVEVVRHIYETHGPDTEILFGPDMWLGAYVEKELGRRMHVWDGECHVHAGIRPEDIAADARGAPRRGFPDPPRVRLLHQRHGVRGLGRHRPRRACTCSQQAGCSDTRARPRGPAGAPAPGARPSWRPRPACSTRCAWRPRTWIHPREPRGLVHVHEDDHAAEAA